MAKLMLIFLVLAGKWKAVPKLSTRERFFLNGFQFYTNIPASRAETLNMFEIC